MTDIVVTSIDVIYIINNASPFCGFSHLKMLKIYHYKNFLSKSLFFRAQK